MTFSVWNTAFPFGHALFAGNLRETVEFLDGKILDGLEVSALDLYSMHSLEPVSAVKWFDWYHQAAESIRQNNRPNGMAIIPSPTVLAVWEN